MTPRFYIASGLENAAAAQRVAADLTARGWTLTYGWWTHGSVQAEGVERIAEVAALERRGVLSADVVIALLPGGNGTHWEMGIADGAGIPVVLCGTEAQRMRNGRECAFYRGAHVRIVESEEEIVGAAADMVTARTLTADRWRSLERQETRRYVETLGGRVALETVRVSDGTYNARCRATLDYRTDSLPSEGIAQRFAERLWRELVADATRRLEQDTARAA